MRTKVYLWKDNAQIYSFGEGRKKLPKTYHFSDFGLSSLVTRLLSEENLCCRKTSYRREYMIFHF